MEKFATLAGFTKKSSADTNFRKVLKKVMSKDATASPEAGRKAGGRKRKAGMSFSEYKMHGTLLTIYQIAAMESDGDEGAEDTPSK